MTTPRTVGIYRALLRLYPRRFREEYGVDMALLFANQLRDESAARVWLRGVIDLIVTVPARRLEVHMSRDPNSPVTVVLSVVSIAGALLALIVGSNLGMVGFGLSVAVLAGVCAVAARRNSRSITAARPVSAHWWKFLAGGAIVVAALVIVTTITGDVDGAWTFTMLVLLSGLVLCSAGIVLGIARLFDHRHAST